MARAIDNVEYIPHDVHHSIMLFHYSGMWPPLNKSILYDTYTFILFCLLGVTFPITQFMNMFYVNSVEAVIDHFFISITCLNGTFKAINIYVQQKNIRQIFAMHREMLRESDENDPEERVRFANVTKMNMRIFRFFISLYFTTWSTIVLQVVLSKPQNRLWPSTYNLPYDWARDEQLYLWLLVYQGFSNMIFAIWIGLEDTFPVILMLMLCGHVDRLTKRLQRLGQRRSVVESRNEQNLRYYEELKNCTLYYESCLKYAYIYILIE